MKKYFLSFIIVLIASGFALSGCKEIKGDLKGSAVLKEEGRKLPEIVITEPQFVGDGKILKTSPIELAGLTFSDIDALYWTNNRGGSGIAEGTINWRIRGVDLQPGDNVLSISARDRSTGRIYRTELKVTYIP